MKDIYTQLKAPELIPRYTAYQSKLKPVIRVKVWNKKENRNFKRKQIKK